MSTSVAASPDATTLVQSLLSRLAIAIARRRAYADAHPMAVQADQALTDALTQYLTGEPTLALAVANRELLVNGTLLQAGGNVVRELASRLHSMGIGTVRLQRGVTLEAVSHLVRLLSRRLNDPSLQEPLPVIAGIALGRIDYEQLGLADEEAIRVEITQLWRALAERMLDTAANPGANPSDTPDSASASTLATALSAASTSDTSAQRAFDALSTLADGVSMAPRAVRDTIGERLQELLSATDQGAIVATLRVAGRADRSRLVRNVVNVLPAAAVVRWLHSAAGATGQDLSPHLLRLLSKMSVHFRGRRPEAVDDALRETAAELVGGWDMQHANPAEHAALLDTLAEWSARDGKPAKDAAVQFDSASQEAARLVQMACEMDLVSEDAALAVKRLADTGHSSTVLAWADRAQSEPTRRQLRDLTLTPSAISRTLLANPLDSAAAKQLLDATHEDVAPVLIDALEQCDTRAGRRLIFDRMRTMDSSIIDAVLQRLAAPMPWFLARNLLSLLRDLLVATPEASARLMVGPLLLFQRHEHVAVRREAIRLLASVPSVRASALRRALDDSTAEVQHAAVDVAYVQRKDELPTDVALRLLTLADQENLPLELRDKAVRAVAGTRQAEVRSWLIAHTTRRARLTGSTKLATLTDTVRAALHVLSTTFAADPEAAPVLTLARKAGALGAAA
ncbi:hypothetical protein [Gemmatimonas phototrophica]|uniref:HEAT repeat domain-containing protein n=1 Tax=Gemmatimonas phototrophica TaxID=1379270 RepID=A0A143BLY9_9BACT|nr:hypothetical protein [Gemmatimonas phototrophica]AMW06028.1 hypothetical protein GEMMAAP_17015 [Gemmatimonas phototrophica]